MTIAQLKYILEIAKTSSINKAAQNLCDAVRYVEPSVDIDPLYQ